MSHVPAKPVGLDAPAALFAVTTGTSECPRLRLDGVGAAGGAADRRTRPRRRRLRTSRRTALPLIAETSRAVTPSTRAHRKRLAHNRAAVRAGGRSARTGRKIRPGCVDGRRAAPGACPGGPRRGVRAKHLPAAGAFGSFHVGRDQANREFRPWGRCPWQGPRTALGRSIARAGASVAENTAPPLPRTTSQAPPSCTARWPSGQRRSSTRQPSENASSQRSDESGGDRGGLKTSRRTTCGLDRERRDRR